MPLYRPPSNPGPAYVAGTYPLARQHGAAVSAVSAVDLLLLRRFRVRAPVTPASFGVRTSTGGAGSSIKVGIWLDKAASRAPNGLPIMSNNAGEGTTGNNANDVATVTGVRMSPLVDYWFGVVFTGTLPTVVMCSNTDLDFADFIGVFAASTAANVVTGYSTPFAYSGDIAALDLTAASLTQVLTTNTPLPLMGVA